MTLNSIPHGRIPCNIRASKEGEENLRQITQTSPYITLPKEEMSAYAILLAYRLQCSLHMLLSSQGKHSLTWEDFVLKIRGTPFIRSLCSLVLALSFADFFSNGYFDYSPKEAFSFLQEDELKDGDTEHIAAFMDVKTMEGYVDLLLLKAHAVFYIAYEKEHGTAYSWENYCNEIFANHHMWRVVTDAFKDALCRINFSAYWKAVDDVGTREFPYPDLHG